MEVGEDGDVRPMDQVAQGARKLRVFISYSRANLAMAEQLVAALEARDIDVLIDRRNLPYGEEWQKQLKAFIHDSDTVIFLISSTSISSKWCLWELQQVVELGKRLVPIVLDAIPYEDLPAAIAAIQLLPKDVTFDLASHLDILVTSLQTDSDWVIENTRLADRARQWLERDRTRDLLLVGRALRDADAWRLRRPSAAPMPSSAILDLIAASFVGARRRQQRWTMMLGFAVLSAIGAVIVVLMLNRELAAATERAEHATAEVVSSVAEQALARGDRRAAIGALAVWPREDKPHPSIDAMLYRALWSMEQRLAVPAAHFSSIDHARFHGSSLLLSSSEGQTIALIDTATGETLRHFLTHPGRVSASAMSRDGTRVAVVTSRGARHSLMEFLVSSPDPQPNRNVDLTRLGDLSGTRALLWYGTSDLLKTVALSKGSRGRRLVWEGQELADGGDGAERVLAVAADQNSILAEREGVVRHVDLRTGSARALPDAEATGHFSLSPRGTAAIAIAADGDLLLWTLEGAVQLVSRAKLPAPGERPVDAWTDKADRYAVAEDKAIRIHCLPAGSLCQKLDTGHDIVLAMTFDDGGTRLRALLQSPGRFGFVLADFQLHDRPGRHDFPGQMVDAVALSGDGQTVFALTNGADLNVLRGGTFRRVSQAESLRALTPWERGGVAALAGYRPSHVVLFDGNGDKVGDIEVPGAASELVVTPSGEIVVAGDNRISKYRRDGVQVGEPFVGSLLGTSPDGRYALSSTSRGQVVLDLGAMRPVRELPVEKGTASLLAHGFVLVVDDDGTAELGDLGGARAARKVTGLKPGDGPFAINATGQLLAVARGARVLVHDLAQGKIVALEHGASRDVGINDHVVQVCFLPGDARILSGATDGKVKLWTTAGAFVADILAFDNAIHRMSPCEHASRQVVAHSQGSEIGIARLLSADFRERLEMARKERGGGSAR